MILEEKTYEKFGYYPADLKSKSNKKIIVKCDDCGEIREISKRDYREYCHSCIIKGERHPSFYTAKKIKVICPECGKETTYPFWIGKKRKYCSQQCYHLSQKKVVGKKTSQWKGGNIKRICQQCGKEFETKPCYIKRGGGKFCSNNCYGIWNSKRQKNNERNNQHLKDIRKHTAKPTKPELIFKEICKRNNLDFHYVGDGQLWIGKKGEKQLNPDFIEANGKKIAVEIFGDYWHSPLLNYQLREEGTLYYRQKHYKRYGWKSIFLWETDLLRKDAEQFILTELKKQGIIL